MRGVPRDELVGELRKEVRQLRQAMETRPVIDQACGIMMASWRCDADTAWEILVDTSQRTNTKLHAVAALVVDSTHTRPMPSWLRSALLVSHGRVTGTAGSEDGGGPGDADGGDGRGSGGSG
ncbi:ANTAR domain-containing protein [Streptomyces daliensis]